MKTNPYAPPIGFANGVEIPERYRVRNSRMTLTEFQNIVDSKAAGLLGWLSARATFGLLDRQVIDAPNPYLQDLCDVDSIPDRLKNYLLERTDQARAFGFEDLYCNISVSSGVVAVGGAARMLHESGKYFLQVVASQIGPIMQGEVHLVSVTGVPDRIQTFATSNSRPKYQRPPTAHAQYFRNLQFQLLLERHRNWMAELDQEISLVTSVEELALVVDHLTTEFFSWQSARGVLMPLP
ncbi:MAG: hypothetical protein HKN47_19375 [Pirellulaceae bacterium]|nr:hypothetical protein [Pirellulaceae bacterium]